MATNLAAVAATDADGSANLGDAATPELVAFSARLAKRYPERVIRRFVFPEGIRQARECFVIEVTSDDELQAASMADAIATPKQRASREAMAQVERREMTRMSVVGLGRLVGGKIAYEMTGTDAPLVEINKWPVKAWVCLGTYYGEVNGVNASELLTGMMAAHLVGTYAAPPPKTPTTETSPTTSESPEPAASVR